MRVAAPAATTRLPNGEGHISLSVRLMVVAMPGPAGASAQAVAENTLWDVPVMSGNATRIAKLGLQSHRCRSAEVDGSASKLPLAAKSFAAAALTVHLARCGLSARTPRPNYFLRQLQVTTDLCIASATLHSRCSLSSKVQLRGVHDL
jgi:hypothetical protein